MLPRTWPNWKSPIRIASNSGYLSTSASTKVLAPAGHGNDSSANDKRRLLHGFAHRPSWGQPSSDQVAAAAVHFLVILIVRRAILIDFGRRTSHPNHGRE